MTRSSRKVGHHRAGAGEVTPEGDALPQELQGWRDPTIAADGAPASLASEGGKQGNDQQAGLSPERLLALLCADVNAENLQRAQEVIDAAEEAAPWARLTTLKTRYELGRRLWLLVEEIEMFNARRAPSPRKIRGALVVAVKAGRGLQQVIRSNGATIGTPRTAESEALGRARWVTAIRLNPDHPERAIHSGQVDNEWATRFAAIDAVLSDFGLALANSPKPEPAAHGGDRRSIDARAKRYVLGALAEVYFDLSDRPPSAGKGHPTRFQRFYSLVAHRLSLPTAGDLPKRVPKLFSRKLPPGRRPFGRRPLPDVIPPPDGWLNSESWQACVQERLRRSTSRA